MQMTHIDALNMMANQGVCAVWLDIANVAIEGDSLAQYFLTYSGKSW